MSKEYIPLQRFLLSRDALQGVLIYVALVAQVFGLLQVTPSLHCLRELAGDGSCGQLYMFYPVDTV